MARFVNGTINWGEESYKKGREKNIKANLYLHTSPRYSFLFSSMLLILSYTSRLTVGDSNANKQLELKMQNLRAHLWENGPVFTYIVSLLYYYMKLYYYIILYYIIVIVIVIITTNIK